MKQVVLLILGGMMSLMGVSPVGAQTLVLHPTEAVVLPADAEGVVRVALRFDVSELEGIEGLRVDHALLTWEMAAVPGEGSHSYLLREPAVAWTGSALAGAPARLQLRETEGALWETEPEVRVAGDGELVLLEMTATVLDWILEPTRNFGVVLDTDAQSAESLTRELAGVSLQLWHGTMR